MTDDEVLNKIFAIRGGYHHFNIDEAYWRQLRKRFKSGKLSQDKKEEIIKICGGEITQQRQWKISL